MSLTKGFVVFIGAVWAGVAPVLAHDGFHPHPHGISVGWVAAAVLGLVAGYLLPRVRGRS